MKATTSHGPGHSDRSQFREVLQAELAERCRRNSRYSLRAFARDLAMDHSSLSKILRGRRKVSARLVEDLAAPLGLSDEEVRRHSAFARLEEARPRGTGEAGLTVIETTTQDTADVISNWIHFAILELTHLAAFTPDTRWIARVLGVTADEANVALQRLLRLGFLAMVSKDKWIDRLGAAHAGGEGFRDLALENLREQIVKVQRGSASEHSQTSLTIAMVRAREPEVRDLIHRFQSDLYGLVGDDTTKNRVYQVEISFFPLTRPEPDKESP